MRRTCLLATLAALTIAHPVAAQQSAEPHGVLDMAIMAGVAPTNNPSSVVWCLTDEFGWYITGSSKASLWVEFLPIGGSSDFSANSLGLRGMFPVSNRVAVYASAGGGVAESRFVSTVVWHGLFDFAGGLDIRLNRRWSIRGELRDYISGRGLGGYHGRQSPTPVLGAAWHF